MDEYVNGLQIIMKTLETIEIKATVDNMEKLLGCQRLLAQIITESQEAKKDGNDNPD